MDIIYNVYLFVIILTPVLTLQRAFFNYDLNIKKNIQRCQSTIDNLDNYE